ncbi:hypothetical protein [Lentilactobacillus sp. SPB1-3]|uniref:Uncharacterized protein n=1 Tax=Lentilactobacillus terminaliae TaxID=3003483 RepID=A0ACD5DD61_9LACO|nr:hypothetical protein [Lentilactobacillus sp. SPB1-3]MCZ0978110.1 hypothetical protein [Lentilactobacillus sp. SPB1-3]
MSHMFSFNATTIITAVITAIGGWIVANHNDSTSREGIYAEHVQDQWDRIDTLSNQLDKVIQERDDLRAQVEELSNQVKEQSRVIDELNTSINSLKKDMEGRNT